MDPATAIGVASSIITFIEIGAKIVKRLEELSQAGDVPKVFRDVRTRLPLILQILERARDSARFMSSETRTAVDEVISNSHEHLEKLGKILQSVTVSPNDSRWRRGAMAVTSLIQEERVERIAVALKGNIDLLTSLNVSTAEKTKFDEQQQQPLSPPPPSYKDSQILFQVPFERDEAFVGRTVELRAIEASLLRHGKAGVVGIGGVGKSQVAIEFCYRYREIEPSAHIFWVWGGNASRFRQDYKRIARSLNLSGCDDPDVDILQHVADWLSHSDTPYLLVLDNADNMKDWWPSKYASMVPDDSDPSDNLVDYLPNCGDKGRLLVTTRDARIASRLAKQSKAILLQPMCQEDARQLFLSRNGEDYAVEHVDKLVQQLDYLPLAISQAAGYLDQHGYYSITEYLDALETDDAEEFLQEELDDDRRHQDSVNSVFKTWKLSFDQVRSQKPRAADLLCMMSMFDRQSIAKSLLMIEDGFKSELTTALGALHALHLIELRANKTTFQLHRLVQRFVRSHIRRARTEDKWRAIALKCVTAAYPVEIGPAEHELCESLAPHVLALISQKYSTDDANLDLATLLCWSADFAVEKNEFGLALRRAQKSLGIFQRLLPETDGRRASATWLYGRLLYYQAGSDEDMKTAAKILEDSLRISAYATMNYAETAFELAHLYFDEGQQEDCLRMGKASHECWKDIEGADSHRTLDAMHDHALALALFGHEEEALEKWRFILKHSLSSHDSSESTRRVFELRSVASIAEFSDDATMAEDFYQKLILLCGALYNEYHIHVFDYRLCHSEQVFRQGRFREAADLAQEILSSCQHSSEWQIHASSLQIAAECFRSQGNYEAEEEQRIAALKLLETNLNRVREETVMAIEALAHCRIRSSKFDTAKPLCQEVVRLREQRMQHDHPEYCRAVALLGVCLAEQTNYAEAEALFTRCLERCTRPDLLVLQNLCVVLECQNKWVDTEIRCREFLQQCEGANGHHDEVSEAGLQEVQQILRIALKKQDKDDAALDAPIGALALDPAAGESVAAESRRYTLPPLPQRRRFGRMIHPRSWSA